MKLMLIPQIKLPLFLHKRLALQEYKNSLLNLNFTIYTLFALLSYEYSFSYEYTTL